MKKRNRTKTFRLYTVGVLFVMVMLVIWGRLIQVQVFARAHYRDIAKNQWKVTRDVPPIRGGIFDREGRPLALSIRSCSIGVHPEEIEDRSKVAAVLAKHLSMTSSSVKKKMRSDKSFAWIKRRCARS